MLQRVLDGEVLKPRRENGIGFDIWDIRRRGGILLFHRALYWVDNTLGLQQAVSLFALQGYNKRQGHLVNSDA
jgi:hypothetical protein